MGRGDALRLKQCMGKRTTQLCGSMGQLALGLGLMLGLGLGLGFRNLNPLRIEYPCNRLVCLSHASRSQKTRNFEMFSQNLTFFSSGINKGVKNFFLPF